MDKLVIGIGIGIGVGVGVGISVGVVVRSIHHGGATGKSEVKNKNRQEIREKRLTDHNLDINLGWKNRRPIGIRFSQPKLRGPSCGLAVRRFFPTQVVVWQSPVVEVEENRSRSCHYPFNLF